MEAFDLAQTLTFIHILYRESANTEEDSSSIPNSKVKIPAYLKLLFK